jgi:hypothetical protein
MTAGQPIIPISALLATIPGNTLYPQFQAQNFTDITDVYSFWMWFTGGVNQAGRLLDYRRVATIDQDGYGITSNQQGQVGVAPPVYYTRFGSILQVSPAPDNNYQYFVRVKLRHPFPYTSPFRPAQFVAFLTAGGAISSISVAYQGAGYPINTSGIPMTFNTPAGGLLSTATATATSGPLGSIVNVTLLSPGIGYSVNNVICNTAMIAAQPVFIPDSWHEIVEYRACWALAVNSGEQEYIVMFDAMLKSKGVDVEAARTIKAQMKRDERHNSRAISLRLGGAYTFR